jgi:hypothetical protein
MYRSIIRCAQLAGGDAGEVHFATVADSRIPAQMFRDDQGRRESAERCGAPHPQRYALAGCGHGQALGGFGVVARRETFPTIDGHAGLWALAAILGRKDKSKTQSSKEQVP